MDALNITSRPTEIQRLALESWLLENGWRNSGGIFVMTSDQQIGVPWPVQGVGTDRTIIRDVQAQRIEAAVLTIPAWMIRRQAIMTGHQPTDFPSVLAEFRVEV